MTAAAKAALERLLDAAKCEGCGVSYGMCQQIKANRAPDDDSPEWMGCCAMGTGASPCQHVVTAGRIRAEIRKVTA